MTKEKGLYPKYFVLRPEKDEAARDALLEYALATTNPQLSEDIIAWLEKLEPDKDWR
jgi:hypothetical protein